MYKNKETVSVEFKQNRKSHPIENVQPHWREKKRGKLNRLHFNERSVSVPKFQFSLVGQSRSDSAASLRANFSI